MKFRSCIISLSYIKLPKVTNRRSWRRAIWWSSLSLLSIESKASLWLNLYLKAAQLLILIIHLFLIPVSKLWPPSCLIKLLLPYWLAPLLALLLPLPTPQACFYWVNLTMLILKTRLLKRKMMNWLVILYSVYNWLSLIINATSYTSSIRSLLTLIINSTCDLARARLYSWQSL